MNVDGTKKLIAIMQAFVDGKEIEIKSQLDDRWFTLKDPVWDAGYRNYRVKPRKEKRKGYINIYINDPPQAGHHLFSSREAADDYVRRWGHIDNSPRVGEAIEIEYEVEID